MSDRVWKRTHDTRAYRRSFIIGVPLVAMSAFLGFLTYRTIGTFPFTMGAIILLGALSLVSGVIGLSVLFGWIVLDNRYHSSY